MHDSEDQAPPFPSADEFLARNDEVEQACAELTDASFEKLGRQLPAGRRQLGTVLSLLYREATCSYGCAGGDHLVERLIGRTVSHALGSYRLIRHGYYDESLALTRGIAEVANLFMLFIAEKSAFEDWKRSEDRQRRSKYGPVQVRLALEHLDAPIPFDQFRYADLCEIGVHTSPSSVPQDFNGARPTLGAILQPAGLIAAMNELEKAVAFAGLGLGSFITSGERRIELFEAQRQLVKEIGAFDLEQARAFAYEASLGRPF